MAFEDLLHPLLKAYVGSPQWVKSSVGSAYALLPRRLRYGAAYGDYRRELLEPAAATAQRKLMASLRWALNTVPVLRPYEHLLAENLGAQDLLRRLPLSTKEDIKADLARHVSTAMPPKARMHTFTGGSTANPMLFYLEKHASRSREYAYIEDFQRRAGLAADDIILALRGRSVPGANQPGGRLWMFEPIKRHLILSSDHLEAGYMPSYLEALRAWQPTFVHAFPSALYPLARWLLERGEQALLSKVKAVLLFSENLYDFQARVLQRAFNCPVLLHYGHSERVLMAATMPDDARYFFWPQYGHLELVDAQGRVIDQPGVLGEIVGTSFDNRVMPFIRYRTGDFACYSAAPEHPLLPGYPVCDRIEGRLQEFLVCHDHRLISITTMGAAHFEELAEVEQIQYEQREAGLVVLNVQTRSKLSAQSEARIAQAVAEKTQGGCRLQVRQVESIARTAGGKHKMLLQHLDIGAYLGAAVADDHGRT